ncbi:diadenosine tetraphosphate (Ap4A) HIT family hydrolase [Sinorhizobium fredii]|uniref:Uncharacterized protein n=1 Tax=Sinorhizobium fredii (strain USDA 257) TaxID=1185652 RepID=I3X509_SINF2|nr:hypothetical protein USDA257_c23890 [Sinorhizobium fredii USDA 257]
MPNVCTSADMVTFQDSIHFHVIPIYNWVEELFWSVARYRLLGTFAEGPGETATDGAEMTLFVWREFCERAEPPPIKGPSVSQAIDLLREEIQFSQNLDA